MNQRRSPTSRRGLRRWSRYAALLLVALALAPFGCHSSGVNPGPAASKPSAGAVVQASLAQSPDGAAHQDPPGPRTCAPDAAFLPAVPPPVADYPIDLEAALGLASAD